MRNDLTQERLKELMHYDPETGVFTWINKGLRRVAVGSRAGCNRPSGYRYIGFMGFRYAEHRLAVLYVTGEWPEHEVDHANGVRSDNRYSNLRPCTHAENHQNRPMPSHNRTGLQGVTWHKQRSKWRAFIGVAGKHKHIGLFDSKEEAYAAYLSAKSQLHTFQPTPRDA